MSRKIVSEPTEDGETIAGLLDRYGVAAGAMHLLKMDIEGDEWPVLERAEPEQLGRFAQIICEFHSFSRAAERTWYDRAKRVMDKLLGGFAVVHVHGNHAAPFTIVGNVPFPDILEVTFCQPRPLPIRGE